MSIWNRSKSKKGGSGSKPATPERPRTKPAEDPGPKISAAFRLGQTMSLKGELVCDLDLEIQGVVEGAVVVNDRTLVVDTSGCARADLTARVVVVRGEVIGDVRASERIVVENSGSVTGDICAPSIQLDDGSRFTGSINREAAPAKVSGQLGGNTEEKPRPETRATAESLVRRQSLSDRRSTSRPWGDDSNRRSSTGEQRPTPTA
jgi:cytoskeletal protein CcmA (bactofilin family)